MSVQDFTYIGIYGLGGRATSSGVDILASQLSGLGLSGFVINQENAVETALKRVEGDARRKIVFGYSMGATDAIDIAQSLVDRGDAVDLVFTMDPHLRREQVHGVRRHINIWQPNNMLLVKPFFEVAEVPEADGYLENILARDIPSHGALDDTPWVQERFIQEVEELLTLPDNGRQEASVASGSVEYSIGEQPEDEMLPPWMVEVNKHVGLHEVRDNRALAEYLRSDGETLGDPASQPWCGDLVETVFRNSLPEEEVPANPYWARNWQHFGVECEPKLHSLLVFTRGNGGHVGFMVGETKTHYIVRGGNQSNSITDTPYAKSRLIAARWPRTHEAIRQREILQPKSKDPVREAFHKAFFDAVRDPLFGGRMRQSQVDGMKMTIDEWFKRPDLSNKRWLAYMLATVWLETDRTMQAIMEYGNRAYFTRMYDITGARPRVARELGNIRPGDGAKYAGRGKPMITGRRNYARATKEVGVHVGVDFEQNPAAVLLGRNSDLIMFSGMIKGWFTGKKLSDYFHDDLEDPIGARRIVNGTDRASEIALTYEDFLTALEVAFEAMSEVIRYQDKVRRQGKASQPSREDVLTRPENNDTVGSDLVVRILADNALSHETREAVWQVANMALAELQARDDLGISQPLFNNSGAQRFSGRSTYMAPEISTEGIKPMNPLAMINGSKMYIVSAIAIMAGVSEGLLGLDIPGIEIQENWLEVVLGGSGFGALSHRLAKLLKALSN